NNYKENSEIVYSYNTTTSKLNTVSGTNFNIWEGKLGNDEGFAYYKATRDSKSDIYKLNLESGIVEKITSSGIISNYFPLNKDVLLTQITKDGISKMQIQALGSQDAKDVPVNTTFSMWPSNYYYPYAD
ncbi:MAG: hypothetical protein WCK31_04260, partial [bacterium]